MSFAEVQILWWLLALPVLVAGGWLAARRRRRRLERFAGGKEFIWRFASQVGRHRRVARHLLLLVAVAAALVALARPQWGSRVEPIHARGVDAILVLDTSRSMAAEDVTPSRIGQARREIATLARSLAGNRIGLVSFAGEPTLNCPLTPDHEAVLLFLDALDVEGAPVQGTSLASALALAARAFGDPVGTQDGRGRAIVLFSDGEDHRGGLESMIPALREAGITVFAVGCGTYRGGPIPLRDAAGIITGYKKDREDKIVTTRLDEASLRKLALETGGRYFQATPTEGEVEEIIASLSKMQTGEFRTVLRPRYEERFQVPLGIALLALLGHTVLGERRTPGAGRHEATRGGVR